MDAPHWFLDELAHAGDEHFDASYVPEYDRKAATDPSAELALLCGLGLNETSTLVDFGAGTGTFALAAAPFCHRVVAVDVSRLMLGQLREKAKQQGIENINYVQRGFLTYEHEGNLADFVYSRHALHHLPDFWKALALQRIAAILKPGGVLYLRDLIFSFELGETERVIEAWLARAPQQPGSGWTRPELETHLREEHSTFSWLLEPMLRQAGFEIRHTHHDDSRIFTAYTCVKVG
jgi:ubiquinone/menaquinone biosynthesis C-methylase UbiE